MNKLGHFFESLCTDESECLNCKQVFPIDQLKLHIGDCMDILPYQCVSCGKSFIDYNECCHHAYLCVKNPRIPNRPVIQAIDNKEPDSDCPSQENKMSDCSDEETTHYADSNVPKEDIQCSQDGKISLTDDAKQNPSRKHSIWDILYKPIATTKEAVPVLEDEISPTSLGNLDVELIPKSISSCREIIDPISLNSNMDLDMVEQIAEEYCLDENLFAEDEFNAIFKAIEHSGAQQIIQDENEKFLQNVIPLQMEPTGSDFDNENNQLQNSSTTLFNLMRSLTTEPVERKNKCAKEPELIKLAKRRRKEIQTEIRKASEITFDKVVDIEDENAREEYEIENEMKHLISDSTTVADGSSFVEEEDYLFAEENCLLDEEFEEIKTAWSSRRQCEEYDQTTNQVQINSYIHQTGRADDSIEARYTCHNCNDFDSGSFLEYVDHLRTHLDGLVLKKTPTYLMKCGICDYTVPQMEYADHVRMHREHERCQYCLIFVPYENIKSHVLSHANHFQCGRCGEIYQTKAAIRKHFTHHLKGCKYICEECHCNFGSLEKMVRHISYFHRAIDPRYSECPYCFDITDNIKNHIYSTGLCKLKCKVCLEVFTSETQFISHMTDHIKNKKNRTFHTTLSVNLQKCKECHFISTDIKKITLHDKCHSIDAQYSKNVPKKDLKKCKICHFVMPSSKMSSHILKHDLSERCLRCYKFVSKNSIDPHMELHESDFKCQICNEVFNSQRKLENHKWAHGRLLQRPCGQCDLLFNSELSRVKHISLIHKNVDPEFVECIYCKELLAVGAGIMEYHLMDPSYCLRRCKLCDMRFKTARQYESHVLMTHKVPLNV